MRPARLRKAPRVPVVLSVPSFATGKMASGGVYEGRLDVDVDVVEVGIGVLLFGG